MFNEANHLSNPDIVRRALTTPSGRLQPGVSVEVFSSFYENSSESRPLPRRADRERALSLLLTAGLFLSEAIDGDEMRQRFEDAPAA